MSRTAHPSVDDAAHFEKRRRLEERLLELGDLVVAFSGGVDSSLLLAVAARVLGARAHAVVADSPSLPREDLAQAEELAASISVTLEVIRTDELDSEAYARNDGVRCYHCKRTLFVAMEEWARENGVSNLAFGEIVDDLADDRPGARAARELSVVAPLSECGFTKDDVRRWARELGLSTAEKPAAACLASRIPVGTRVTAERLARIEAAERAVRERGFRVLRVRDHGTRARLEVGPDELTRARELRLGLSAVLAPLGFEELELAAYRTPGSGAPVA